MGCPDNWAEVERWVGLGGLWELLGRGLAALIGLPRAAQDTDVGLCGAGLTRLGTQLLRRGGEPGSKSVYVSVAVGVEVAHLLSPLCVERTFSFTLNADHLLAFSPKVSAGEVNQSSR